jgi:hypothetical protein
MFGPFLTIIFTSYLGFPNTGFGSPNSRCAKPVYNNLKASFKKRRILHGEKTMETGRKHVQNNDKVHYST